MNKSDFYKKYPNFDWKFYLSHYEDLTHAKLKTEEQAIKHYSLYGHKELRRTHCIVKKQPTNDIIDFNDILTMAPMVSISNSLIHLLTPFKNKYNFKKYTNHTEPCIFFGIYNDLDIQRLYNHRSIKFIVWGGEDVNPKRFHSRQNVNEIKKLNNIIHVSISNCIYTSLLKYNINSILVHFNLVDNSLFKPAISSPPKDTIYIYNGLIPGREHIYGQNIYNHVIQKLPQFKIIYSNILNKPYHEMPSIYEKCFIALRLTAHDGNANMVQECESMNIPVIHNHSEYGIKWRNAKHIINIIMNYTLN